MSYFSTALTRITERNQLRQADVVRDSGLTRSHVSRLFSGEQRTITDEDFISLLKAYRDKRDQAELTVARCMDVRVGPAAQFVEIAVKLPKPGTECAVAVRKDPDVELSHETEEMFRWLRRQCPLSPALEKHLLGFARMMGMP
jgi:transcriptional regulator with XRE-family HTH domain